MNLNERIEAGRTNEVAKSFQAASEMIEKNTVDGTSVALYPKPMGVPPKNHELGRIKSAEKRSSLSRRHDMRLLVAITQAALSGANSLRSLVASLEDAGVPTRRGGPWSVRLASIEMVRIGQSIKSMHSRVQPKPDPKFSLPESSRFTIEMNLNMNSVSGKFELSASSKARADEILDDSLNSIFSYIEFLEINLFGEEADVGKSVEPNTQELLEKISSKLKEINRSGMLHVKTDGAAGRTFADSTMSAEAYDRQMAGEREIALRFGVWVPLILMPDRMFNPESDTRIRSHKIIKHKYFWFGQLMEVHPCACRFVDRNNNYTFVNARPVDVDVFFWSDDIHGRDEKIAALRREVKRMPLVSRSSLTDADRAVRVTALRWLGHLLEVCPTELGGFARRAQELDPEPAEG